jgi:uncharacterized protein YcfJ
VRTLGSRALPLLILGLVAVGCAAKRPVVYPDPWVQEAGESAVQQDIDACHALAAEHDLEAASPARQTLGRAAVGSVAGAAIGTAVGAVFGNPGRGAGAGAAGGATRGGLRGLAGSREPDPVERAFVEECLRERGYRPIGWR